MTDRPSHEPDHERLAALEKKLAEKRRQAAPPPAEDDKFRQADLAWRMVIEMVSGLGIGFGIGYGLDLLVGTTPWLMLVMTLLGLVAGVRVMMRTAAEMNKVRPAGSAAEEEGSQS